MSIKLIQLAIVTAALYLVPTDAHLSELRLLTRRVARAADEICIGRFDSKKRSVHAPPAGTMLRGRS